MENVSFNKDNNLTENDIGRRNRIASLLKDWGLINISSEVQNMSPLSQIKIISFKEKSEWTLETKYNIGKTKDENSI
jgi:hypothetical protein